MLKKQKQKTHKTTFFLLHLPFAFSFLYFINVKTFPPRLLLACFSFFSYFFYLSKSKKWKNIKKIYVRTIQWIQLGLVFLLMNTTENIKKLIERWNLVYFFFFFFLSCCLYFSTLISQRKEKNNRKLSFKLICPLEYLINFNSWKFPFFFLAIFFCNFPFNLCRQKTQAKSFGWSLFWK